MPATSAGTSVAPAMGASAATSTDQSVAVSTNAAATTAATTGYQTITAPVVGKGTTPAAYVAVTLNGKTFDIFTSQLGAATIGQTVTATGYYNSLGNFQASSASIVAGRPTPAPTTKPTTGPTAAPTTKPTTAPTSAPTPVPSTPSLPPPPASGSTLGRIALHQVFDMNMTNAMRTAAGPRYDVVWGANSPTSWTADHASLLAGRYTIVEQSDASHPLSWFEANHPDWILYNCTSSGTPTKTVAYQLAGAYGYNAPIDMHNPAAVDFMIRNVAIPQAKAGGYNALSLDQVVFSNIMGGNAGSGSYGCGVYSNGTFVRRYNGAGDYNWAVDMVNWVKAAHTLAAQNGLKVIINHPAGSVSSSLEQQLLANTDAALNENGFSYYGYYKTNASGFATALNYMTYVQSLGHTAMLINKFIQSGALSAAQREWVVATYLMGNNGHALLYSTYGGYGTGGYGSEHYLSEYATNLGQPCGAYTSSGSLYTRKFANGLVLVNANPSAAAVATLPHHTYTDIEGRLVTPLLAVPGTDAFVLTTAAGTGCY